MSLVLSREQVRAVDQRAIQHYGLHSLVLMENAGRGATDVLERLGIQGLVVILCGRGNNGGDGFVMARHLRLRGFDVKVLVWDAPDRMSGDARANYEVLVRSHAPLVHLPPDDSAQLEHELRAADWILDALLGTGARGAPRPPYDQAIELANHSPARRLAVDWPSGLDCDSGEPSSCVFKAHETCTFVAQKRGAAHPQAAGYLGRVHVVDIGVPREVIDDVVAGKK